MRRSSCKCAVSEKQAPFGDTAAARGQNAAASQRERDRPDRTAATLPRHASSGKYRLRQKAIPFRVQHVRRTPARCSHRRPPHDGRIQQAARQTDTAARHGSKHTVEGCGTPLSLAENRRARRRRKPFCVQYVRLRAFLVTGWEDAATDARRTATAAFCAPQTPHGGVFPLRASPVPSAIIIPYFGENDKDSSKDFSQIAKFYPSFIFFS